MDPSYFKNEIQDIQDELAALKAAPYSNLVFFLEGPLGAGKTAFVKEWLSQVEGFPANEIQSPTFLKVLEYDLGSDRKALHMDCYRMESGEDLSQLSLESYVDTVQIYFIEWPKLFSDYLRSHAHYAKSLEPACFVHVNIDHQGTDWHGPRLVRVRVGLSHIVDV